MSSSINLNASASTPDTSGVEFSRTADGLAVARIDDLVLAMVPTSDSFAYLASGFAVTRPLEELTLSPSASRNCSRSMSGRRPTRRSGTPGLQPGRRYNGRPLAEGESRSKDRAAFDAAHSTDFVVTSAIRSDHHLGMTEVVAVVGGGRARDGEERRFLVPCDEYAARGRFGFVIDPDRHQPYDGPSSFVGWRQRGQRT